MSTTWAWWRSRSTVAVARVLGMIVSNPEGCRLTGDRDGAAFVGGVDDAVERLAGGLPGGQHADVIDHDELGSGDPGDGLGDRPVHGGAADRGGQGLQGEPGDPHPVIDDLVREGFDEVGLPGARWVRRSRGSPRGRPIPGWPARSGCRVGSRSRSRARTRTSSRPGSPAALRRIRRVASSRPRISSVIRTRRTSAGSQRCARAVASTSGAASRR